MKDTEGCGYIKEEKEISLCLSRFRFHIFNCMLKNGDSQVVVSELKNKDEKTTDIHLSRFTSLEMWKNEKFSVDLFDYYDLLLDFHMICNLERDNSKVQFAEYKIKKEEHMGFSGDFLIVFSKDIHNIDRITIFCQSRDNSKVINELFDNINSKISEAKEDFKNTYNESLFDDLMKINEILNKNQGVV